MTSTYTTNKSIEKPANGDYVNTWSTPVNSDWDIIDVSLGGTTTLNATGVSGTVTLTATQYRPPTIIITGTLTANVTYSLPSGVGGHWVIYNNTSGAYTVTFASAGGGTSTTLTQGQRVLVYCDGTNTALGVTATSISAGGSSGQVQFNSSGSLAGSSNLTFDGTNLVLGATGAGELRIRNTLKIYGTTSGYFGLTVPTAAGSTTYTLPNADGTNGQVLTTNGGGTLTWTTVSGGAAGVTSFSAGSTGLTPTGATTGAVALGGTLNATAGGTGIANYTIGDTVYADSTTTLAKLSIGAANTVMTSTGTAPQWSSALSIAGTMAASSFTDSNGKIRAIPKSGSDKTTNYTLATSDVGLFVQVASGGSITIPNSTFATGDVVSIINNTSAGITITCNTTNAYIVGTDANKTSVTLATRGVATVLFSSSTLAFISGNVS